MYEKIPIIHRHAHYVCNAKGSIKDEKHQTLVENKVQAAGIFTTAQRSKQRSGGYTIKGVA